MTTIIGERLKALDSITLQRGAHDSNGDKQFCAMEAAAWIAGEPHSDHPQCVSPVLGAFVRALNDALDDEQRQALKPCIPRMIGTAGDGHDEERAWMAVDWLVRVCTPAWLDLAGLKDSAEALRSLPPITEATVNEGERTVEAARERAAAAGDAAGTAARATAWTAAWDAAGDATWTAAWTAAWVAAGDAARVAALARDAIRVATRVAARDAARAAVWAAAWVAALEAEKQGGGSGAIKERFAPVKAELHRSAHELLERMIDGPFGEENA